MQKASPMWLAFCILGSIRGSPVATICARLTRPLLPVGRYRVGLLWAGIGRLRGGLGFSVVDTSVDMHFNSEHVHYLNRFLI